MARTRRARASHCNNEHTHTRWRQRRQWQWQVKAKQMWEWQNNRIFVVIKMYKRLFIYVCMNISTIELAFDGKRRPITHTHTHTHTHSLSHSLSLCRARETHTTHTRYSVNEWRACSWHTAAIEKSMSLIWTKEDEVNNNEFLFINSSRTWVIVTIACMYTCTYIVHTHTHTHSTCDCVYWKISCQSDWNVLTLTWYAFYCLCK